MNKSRQNPMLSTFVALMISACSTGPRPVPVGEADLDKCSGLINFDLSGIKVVSQGDSSPALIEGSTPGTEASIRALTVGHGPSTNMESSVDTALDRCRSAFKRGFLSADKLSAAQNIRDRIDARVAPFEIKYRWALDYDLKAQICAGLPDKERRKIQDAGGCRGSSIWNTGSLPQREP